MRSLPGGIYPDVLKNAEDMSNHCFKFVLMILMSFIGFLYCMYVCMDGWMEGGMDGCRYVCM